MITQGISKTLAFFHPDYTVAFGISPNRVAFATRGVYRRWGLAPRPEGLASNTTSEA